jgi:hypothetical protein
MLYSPINTALLLIPQVMAILCCVAQKAASAPHCPSYRLIERSQESLDGFALGNLTVAKDRCYLPPASGGLGWLLQGPLPRGGNW